MQNMVINTQGCFNLDVLMTPAGTAPAAPTTVKVDISRVNPATDVHVGSSMTNPTWVGLPTGYPMPVEYNIYSLYVPPLVPGSYYIVGDQGVIRSTINFIATLQIRFLVNGNWSNWQDIAKNSTVNAPAGATQAEVKLPEWFTYSGGNSGSNALILNTSTLIGTGNQSLYTLTQSGSYECQTMDGYGPNPTDITDFQLMFHVEQPTIITHPSSQSLTVGDNLSLSVAATGDNLSYQWKKDGNDIFEATNATYTKSNVQTGDAGSYVCTVSNAGGSVTSNAATVTVQTIPVTGVSLDKTTLNLTVGGSETLTATVAPANATNKNVTWSSNNSAVATVNASSGEVTAVTAGTATITATTQEGGFTASCNVTVVVPVTGVTLNKENITLTVGGSETLVATIAPANAANQNVTWSSNAPAVATVNNSGEVTAIAAGAAVITATTQDGGFTASCGVTVTDVAVAVTGVSLDKTTLSLTVGGSETLVATVAPTNAANPTVTWSSNAPAVATVNNSGEVTAIAAGDAVITATTQDGGFTASCGVMVEKAARLHKYLDYSVTDNTVKVWVAGAAEGETFTLQIDGTEAARWEFTIEGNRMYHLRAASTNVILEAWVKK
jgi:uncharacterized protein YjdB